MQEELEVYRALRACPACDGARLKPESVAVRVKGRTVAEYVNLPIGDAYRAFSEMELTHRESIIADRILREIQDRLRFLVANSQGFASVIILSMRATMDQAISSARLNAKLSSCCRN